MHAIHSGCRLPPTHNPTIPSYIPRLASRDPRSTSRIQLSASGLPPTSEAQVTRRLLEILRTCVA